MKVIITIILAIITSISYGQYIGEYLNDMLKKDTLIGVSGYRVLKDYIEIFADKEIVYTVFYFSLDSEKMFGIDHIFKTVEDKNNAKDSLLKNCIKIGENIWLDNDKTIKIDKYSQVQIRAANFFDYDYIKDGSKIDYMGENSEEFLKKDSILGIVGHEKRDGYLEAVGITDTIAYSYFFEYQNSKLFGIDYRFREDAQRIRLLDILTQNALRIGDSFWINKQNDIIIDDEGTIRVRNIDLIDYNKVRELEEKGRKIRMYEEKMNQGDEVNN